jgi:hypothetical protein
MTANSSFASDPDRYGGLRKLFTNHTQRSVDRTRVLAMPLCRGLRQRRALLRITE